jgi:hypothetical protein
MRKHCTALRPLNTVRGWVTGENPVTDRSENDLKTLTAIIRKRQSNLSLFNVDLCERQMTPLISQKINK